MNEPKLAEFLQLRLAVGYLGERDQFAWWPTSFFAATSSQFLEPVFVRTASQAQYHGVLEAARRVHDEHLSVGSFHLFRLPEEMEQDLFAIVRRDASVGYGSIAPASRDDALSTLRGFSTTSGSTAPQGPTLVGNIDELAKPKTIAAIAGTYLHAFSSGTQAYPYFFGKR